MASREVELSKLRDKAHHLWEGQAAGKGFVHRVSQLSAQYLSLSNLTKVTLLLLCSFLTQTHQHALHHSCSASSNYTAVGQVMLFCVFTVELWIILQLCRRNV